MSHNETHSAESEHTTALLKASQTSNQSFKSFLNSNKIYFETIAATLLSFMAVIIAGVQIAIGFQQSDLIELQTEAEKQQSLPQFLVVRNFDSEYELVPPEDKLEIYNYGNVAHNVNLTTMSFIKVVYITSGKSVKQLSRDFAILNYYNTTFHTNTYSGLIFWRVGYGNFAKSIELDKELNTQLPTIDWVDVSIETYVRISYQDVFAEQRVDYYKVDGAGVGQKISIEEGIKIYTAYENAENTGAALDYDQLTSDDLFQAISEMVETSLD
jgi:hypothetical protein